MTLKERLNADFKEAMKNKEKVRKETISFVRAAITQYEVDNREEIDDAGIASILAKQVKMRKDALADFESAGKYRREDYCYYYLFHFPVLRLFLYSPAIISKCV